MSAPTNVAQASHKPHRPAGDITWMDQGACVGHDPELWFPTAKGKGALKQAETAAYVCQGCPVRQECEDYAAEQEIPAGVWGGELRTKGSTGGYRPIPPHGTDARYHRHRSDNEEPCADCKEAHRITNRKWPRR